MRKITLLILCGLLTVPMVAWSQPVSENLEGVRVYGRQGYPKITVYVWGEAQSGVWLVEEDTDLIEFLSISARGDMTLRQPERRSETYIKIYRDGTSQGGDDPFFNAKINDLFSRQRSYPSLQDGDVLVVETRVRRRFTWRDLSQVVGTLTSGISLYLLLSGDR